MILQLKHTVMNVGLALISFLAAMIASLPILAAPPQRTSAYGTGDENITSSSVTINTSGYNETTSLAEDDESTVQIDRSQNISEESTTENYSINTDSEDVESSEMSEKFKQDGNVTNLGIDNRTNDETPDNSTWTQYTDTVNDTNVANKTDKSVQNITQAVPMNVTAPTTPNNTNTTTVDAVDDDYTEQDEEYYDYDYYDDDNDYYVTTYHGDNDNFFNDYTEEDDSGSNIFDLSKDFSL
ncbi:hypothetical protein ScPMuIL_008500 [Solemya velum]